MTHSTPKIPVSSGERFGYSGNILGLSWGDTIFLKVRSTVSRLWNVSLKCPSNLRECVLGNVILWDCDEVMMERPPYDRRKILLSKRFCYLRVLEIIQVYWNLVSLYLMFSNCTFCMCPFSVISHVWKILIVQLSFVMFWTHVRVHVETHLPLQVQLGMVECTLIMIIFVNRPIEVVTLLKILSVDHTTVFIWSKLIAI